MKDNKNINVIENAKKKKVHLIITAIALIAIINSCNPKKGKINSAPDKIAQSSESSLAEVTDVTTEKSSETENIPEEETITDTDISPESFVTEETIIANADISLEGFVEVAGTTDVTVEETIVTDANMSPESFVSSVEEIIQGAVGFDEFITAVNLTEGTLTVSVDLSKADTTIVSLKDLAVVRASSITDAILELKQYDDFWNEMVVDFNGIGSVKRTKNDIKDSTYGRYFEIDELDS